MAPLMANKHEQGKHGGYERTPAELISMLALLLLLYQHADVVPASQGLQF